MMTTGMTVVELSTSQSLLMPRCMWESFYAPSPGEHSFSHTPPDSMIVYMFVCL